MTPVQERAVVQTVHLVHGHPLEPVGGALDRVDDRHRLAGCKGHDDVRAGADVVEHRVRADGRARVARDAATGGGLVSHPTSLPATRRVDEPAEKPAARRQTGRRRVLCVPFKFGLRFAPIVVVAGLRAWAARTGIQSQRRTSA